MVPNSVLVQCLDRIFGIITFTGHSSAKYAIEIRTSVHTTRMRLRGSILKSERGKKKGEREKEREGEREREGGEGRGRERERERERERGYVTTITYQ